MAFEAFGQSPTASLVICTYGQLLRPLHTTVLEPFMTFAGTECENVSASRGSTGSASIPFTVLEILVEAALNASVSPSAIRNKMRPTSVDAFLHCPPQVSSDFLFDPHCSHRRP